MISDNIKNKAAAVLDERRRFEAGEIKDTPIATELENMSTQAILEGQGVLPDSTPGWIAYMSLFSTPNNPAELDRLIPRDNSTDAVRQTARAYLVANGKCGMGTTENLPTNVGTKLD